MKRAILLAAALALPAAAADEVKTTEAEGYGPVVEGDLASAKQRARDDAMRSCVQQVASTVLTAATETDQAQLLSDKIYAHSEGYVRGYETLEDRQDGNSWVVKLRCKVAEGKLDEDLMAFGIAYRREGMPRVMVLIAEQAIHATQATGWWQGGGNAADLRVVENAFMDRMQKSGFSFVDPEVLSGKLTLQAVGADPNAQQAREIGKLAGAEVVVVGRVIAKPVGQMEVPGGALFAAVANVSARAVRTDTGQVMASAELTGKITNDFEQSTAGRKALSEAGRQLAGDLFAKIGKAWAREQSGGRHVTLTILGVDDYARLAAFKAQLVSGVRGVKDVQERSMEGGRADLEVVLAGTSESLATDLATRKFPGFTVKVKKRTAGAVEVELGDGKGK